MNQLLNLSTINLEIERLFNKRIIKKGRGLATEYLVRWKEYGSEYDQWYNIKDLDNASELVKEYKEKVVRIRAVTLISLILSSFS